MSTHQMNLTAIQATEYSSQNSESRMRRLLPIFAAVLLTPGFWLLDSGAQGLPTYEDFARSTA